MIKAVILDFDDTLCLTQKAGFALENEALAKMGRSPMSLKIHKATWGQPLPEAIKLRSPGIDAEAFLKTFAPLMKQHFQEGRIDHVSEINLAALRQLASDNKTLLLVTSRSHEEAEHILHTDHVLSQHIEAFYYRGNMDYHKPDPRAFGHIERNHGWKPEECVYVGDSLSDAASAKGAGLHFIASLESGLRTRKDFAHYPVDEFVSSFPDIVAAVQKIEDKIEA